VGPERSEREKGEGERRGEAKQAARCSRAKRATAKRARAGGGGQLGRVRCGPTGERSSGPSEQAARVSHRVGRARQGRPGKGEGEEGRASWARR